jgi:hypothetical protein
MEYQESAPFALLPIASFENPDAYDALSPRIWGNERVYGLDAWGATNRSLRGDLSVAGVVIIDPEGRIAWRGSDPHKPNDFYADPDKQLVPFVDLKENIAPHLDKGLLGGLAVPARARGVVTALRTGELALAQARLSELREDGFKKALRERLEALRLKKRSLFEKARSSGRPWSAYKVGQSYLRCFPEAKDARDMKDVLRTLQSRSEVMSNLAAKKAFGKIVAAYGRKGTIDHPAAAVPLLKAMAERYPDTEYGKIAYNACASGKER